MIIEEIAGMLGFGGEIIMVLSVGLIAWYLIRALSVGKTAATFVESGVKMLAFAILVLAVGIALDWWDPAFGEFIADVWTAIGVLINWVPRLITRLIEVVGSI